MDHARSSEVLSFCIKELSEGTTYNELRRKLGLGPANIDTRWREIRTRVLDGMVPTNEQEALKAQADQRAYLLTKLESFMEDVEGMLLSLPNNEEDRKLIPNLLKLKLESVRTLLEENAKSFEAYLSLKRIKEQDKRTRGQSILIQNNYHINRPGQNEKEVLETASRVQKIIGGSDD